MTNQTIQLLHTHRINRAFLQDLVSDAILDQIVVATHRGPISINAQQISPVHS